MAREQKRHIKLHRIRRRPDGLTGNIASISYDVDILGQRFVSDNPKAPQFRLYAKSPRGRTVEIGGLC